MRAALAGKELFRAVAEGFTGVLAGVRAAPPITNPALTQYFNSPLLAGLSRDYTQQQITDGFTQHPTVYAIISSIAQAASSAPFQVMRSTASPKTPERRREFMQRSMAETRHRRSPLGPMRRDYMKEAEAEPVVSGEYYELFRSPNPYCSGAQLTYTLSVHYQKKGNAFLIKESGTNQRIGPNEIPKELWPVNPDFMKYVLDDTNGLLKGWVLTVNGKTINYLPHEVIHFKIPNPNDPIMGLAPMDAAMGAIRQDWKASIFDESFFDNGGKLGGVIENPNKLEPSDARAIKTVFEDNHAGQGRSHRVAILHSGSKWINSAETHKDMEYIEGRKWNREQLLAIWKCPKIILGVYEDINYATSQTAYRLFWMNAVIPMLCNFEETLTQQLFVPAGAEYEFGIYDMTRVDAMRDDLSQKVGIFKELFNNGFSRNELNEKLELGFEASDRGDTQYIGTGLVPVTSLDDYASIIEGDSEDQPPISPPVKEEKKPDPDPKPGEKPKEEPKAETKPDDGDRAAKAKSFEQWRARAARVLDPGEQIFLGKFRRYLYELRRDVLARIEKVNQSRGFRDLKPEDLPALLFSQQEWDKKLRAQVGDKTYLKIMKLSWEDSATQIGSELAFVATDPRVLSFVGKKLGTLVKVNGTIRKQLTSMLNDVLNENLEEGTTVLELQKAIRAQFNDWSDHKALTIARTETGMASSQAQAMVFGEENVRKVEWLSAEDEQVRESHRDQNRLVVDYGTPFPNGLKWPLEFGAPVGEVANCRCVLNAVS